MLNTVWNNNICNIEIFVSLVYCVFRRFSFTHKKKYIIMRRDEEKKSKFIHYYMLICKRHNIIIIPFLNHTSNSCDEEQ